MSERIRWRVLRGAAVAGLLPGVLLGPGAQLRAQTAEEYRQRIERLLPDWRAAVAAERSARPRVEPDTVRAGSLTLLARPGSSAFAEQVAERAWQRLVPRLRSDSTLLAGQRVQLIAPGDERPTDWVRDEAPAVRVAELEGAEAAASRVMHQLGRQLALRLDEATARWLGGEVPLVPIAGTRLEGLYVDLATADSRSARACVGGDLDACRAALGFVTAADTLTVWFLPEQLRRRVEERSHPPSLRLQVRRCLDGLDDSACLKVVRQYPAHAFAPLSQYAHRLLAQLALERGGDGAYRRFLEPEATGIEGRLVQASGAPLDSLIETWRLRVLANRPEPTLAGPRVTLIAVMWIAMLIFLATRSTRWRSG